jgi:hypothetical protein
VPGGPLPAPALPGPPLAAARPGKARCQCHLTSRPVPVAAVEQALIATAVAHAGGQVCGIDRYSTRPDPPAVRYGAEDRPVAVAGAFKEIAGQRAGPPSRGCGEW